LDETVKQALVKKLEEVVMAADFLTKPLPRLG
jgi:hypothetical protein